MGNQDTNEWQSVDYAGASGRVDLSKSLISRYFPDGLNPRVDLAGYMIRNNSHAVLELISGDKRSGYVFIGELQVNRNVEGRLAQVRRMYEAEGRIVERLFLDLKSETRMAGFEWRRGIASDELADIALDCLAELRGKKTI